MKLKEIADMLGISQSYISRLEKKVLLKLRDDLNKFINLLLYNKEKSTTHMSSAIYNNNLDSI